MAAKPNTKPDAVTASKIKETLPRGTVVLRVGEERFIVKPETLSQESVFFDALFSGRWSQAEPDGSYYIDYDPAVFKHVLRYLRLGNYPLCLNKDQRLDYAAYSDLLTAADYFGITDLGRWIQEKRYERVMTTEYQFNFRAGGTGILRTPSQDVEITDTEEEQMIWYCPLDKFHHKTEQQCRDNDCTEYLVNAKPYRFYYEKRMVRGLRVQTKTTNIDHHTLRKG